MTREAPAAWLQVVNTALQRRDGTKAGAGGELTIRCLEPDHEDRDPSATWNAETGCGLCHACDARWSVRVAAERLGLALENRPGTAPGTAPGEQQWEIRTAEGELVAVHHRVDRPDGTKSMWWTRPGGEKGLGGMKAADLPLYGSEWLRNRQPGDDTPLFIVEGERAAGALMAVGLSAVGTVTGCKGTPGAGPLEVLQGRHVVLWPDADQDGSGAEHMRRVAEAIKGIAGSWRIFEPADAPDKGDAVDWLQARAGKPQEALVAELLEAVEGLPVERPKRSSWAPVDLAEILAGTYQNNRPVCLLREDGEPLFYVGINWISGEPESVKTWIALEAARQEIAAGRTVVFIDVEDSPAGIVGRLRALGVGGEAIRRHFLYVSPEERIAQCPADVEALVSLRPALVIIDAVAGAMAMEGLNPDSNSEVVDYLQRLPRVLAKAGAVVVLIDHVTKSRDGRGRYAIGAQAKLASVTGAAYGVKTTAPFSRGHSGRAGVYLNKDRCGWIAWERRGDKRLVCEVEALSLEGGDVRLRLVAPTSGGDFMPTFLMERVSRALEVEDKPRSAYWCRESVTGNKSAIGTAVEKLAELGYIRKVDDGKSNSKGAYTSIRPYREDKNRPSNEGAETAPADSAPENRPSAPIEGGRGAVFQGDAETAPGAVQGRLRGGFPGEAT